MYVEREREINLYQDSYDNSLSQVTILKEIIRRMRRQAQEIPILVVRSLRILFGMTRTTPGNSKCDYDSKHKNIKYQELHKESIQDLDIII